MRNNGENVNYIIMFALMILTIAFFIFFRGNTAKQPEANCNCAEIIKAEVKSALTDYSYSVTTDKSKSSQSDVTLVTEKTTPPKTLTEVEGMKFDIGESVPLPTLPTHVKTYTDYRYYSLWYTRIIVYSRLPIPMMTG